MRPEVLGATTVNVVGSLSLSQQKPPLQFDHNRPPLQFDHNFLANSCIYRLGHCNVNVFGSTCRNILCEFCKRPERERLNYQLCMFTYMCIKLRISSA